MVVTRLPVVNENQVVHPGCPIVNENQLVATGPPTVISHQQVKAERHTLLEEILLEDIKMDREEISVDRNMTLLDWSLISLIIIKIKHVLMPTMHSIFTDALGLRRMSSDCPGDRFEKCHQWKKIHLNCLVSRGFEIITKQLGENLIIFTPDTLEKKRFLIETVLRLRYQFYFTTINDYFDREMNHEDQKDHQNPCIQCFKYKMMRLYHEKQLELEYAKGIYFDKFFTPLDETEPLDQHILRYTFIDWHLYSNLTAVKRKNKQVEAKKKKLKRELETRQEQLYITLNK